MMLKILQNSLKGKKIKEEITHLTPPLLIIFKPNSRRN